MQLDKTHIVVRERGLLDTFDLSLQVLRAHFGPLCALSACGAVPFLLINHLLLGWIVLSDDRSGFFYSDDYELILRFLWDMSVLVALETPLASALATAYIGQALFVERPSLRRVAGDVAKLAPRLTWCQLLMRGVLPAWLILSVLERGGDFEANMEVVLLGLLAAYVACLRLWRPFINEIILLERNPLLTRVPGTLTAGRRSQQLHGPSAGDLFFRGLGSALLAGGLTLAVFGSFLFVTGVLFNDWQPGPVMVAYVFPLSMWIVASFMTVVRFLNYLDLRIRHEGWEVELRLRAEGERATSRVSAVQ